jgi:hypothetical protein
MRSRTGQRRVEARGGLNLPAHQPLYHPAIELFHTVKMIGFGRDLNSPIATSQSSEMDRPGDQGPGKIIYRMRLPSVLASVQRQELRGPRGC